MKLPGDYIAFLGCSDGAEGPIGSAGYLSLWSAEEIPNLNRTAAVDEFAPGLMVFGTDGGDTAYAFDFRGQAPCVAEVPMVGMSLEETRRIASSFTEFLELMAADEV